MISRCAQFEFKAEKQWLCCCLWDHDDLFKCFLDFVSCNIDHFGCLWNCHLHLQYESKWCVIKTKNSARKSATNIFEHKSSSGIEADSVLDALLHGRGLAVRLWLETLQKLPSTQLCRWQLQISQEPCSIIITTITPTVTTITKIYPPSAVTKKGDAENFDAILFHSFFSSRLIGGRIVQLKVKFHVNMPKVKDKLCL